MADANVPRRQLTKICIFYLPGAHAFPASELAQALSSPPTRPTASLPSDWHDTTAACVSDVGRSQLRSLATWFCRYVAAKGLEEPRIQHAPYGADEVAESHSVFIETLRGMLPSASFTATGAPASGAIPWYMTDSYKAQITSLAASETVQKAALKVRAKLESLMDKVQGGMSAVDDTDAEDIVLAESLLRTVHAKHLYDCEIAWPATALAIQNSKILQVIEDTAAKDAPPRGCDISALLERRKYCHPKADAIAVIPGIKNTLLKRLTLEDEIFLNHAAWWVWDYVSFGAQTRHSSSATGSGLLQDMFTHFSTTDANVLVHAVSTPDLLGILAALRVRKGPTSVPGHAACLTLEMYLHTDPAVPGAKTSADIKMLCTPFPLCREGLPCDLSLASSTVIAEEVSEQSLQQMFATRDKAHAAKSYGTMYEV